MYEARPFDVYFDASLTGLGGTFDNFVYTMPFLSEYCTWNIAHSNVKCGSCFQYLGSIVG